jgi:nitric-oxide synthase
MLTDKPLLSTSASTCAVFTSDAQYAPAVQLMSLLTDGEFALIRALKRFGVVASTNSAIEWVNINTVSKDIIQEYFCGAETAFVFIMPTDLADITQLTRSMLEMATEAGVRRFAWIAPACPTECELSDRLTEAANLVRSSGLETLVLCHAPLLSDLLEQKKEVNYPNLPSTVEVGASVITGECLNLDFRPRVGLTCPPTAETAEPSAKIILIPSALIFAAAFPSRS